MDGNHQKLRKNSGKMMLKILYEPCIEMTAAIQYILTAAQSLGSQDHYKMSRMTIFGYYSWKTSRHRQNELSYVPKKILTWMLREARRKSR